MDNHVGLLEEMAGQRSVLTLVEGLDDPLYIGS